jgi:hypothetical protein
MLHSEIIAVCSQIQKKHINTLCGQNVELLNVKRGGTYSDHPHKKPIICGSPVLISALYRLTPTEYNVCTQEKPS